VRRAYDELEARIRRLEGELRGLDVQSIDVRAWIREEGQSEYLLAEAQREREAAFSLETVLGALESAAAVETVSELEQQVAAAQRSSDEAEALLALTRAAEERVKMGVAGIRRGVNELVEERLAALAPLLQSLYARLRPHVDWQEVHYLLRGEVRRFLSLRVGDNMNPRFMFSSGQRRAAGLAFLLAVHLSRPWCRLDTLIMDDPVQHIDDYRALHLVEVLTGIRRAGRQVICTVEDPALAQLLARRLRGETGGGGAIIEMQYVPGEGISVVSQIPVTGAAPAVLMSA
jgi:DNA repair exonuclease SbcCD ATPase subunit